MFAPLTKKRAAHVLEPTEAVEQTTSSDVPQDQRRGSAVLEKQARECSVFLERCSVCSLDQIRGAVALLLEPAKTVEQAHVFDVLQK